MSSSMGDFIAKVRKEKGITQEQLAERLGISNKSISRYENGITEPDLSMLSFIATELGVEVSEIINGERMEKEELVVLKKTVNNIVNYSSKERWVCKLHKLKCVSIGLISLFIAAFFMIINELDLFIHKTYSIILSFFFLVVVLTILIILYRSIIFGCNFHKKIANSNKK